MKILNEHSEHIETIYDTVADVDWPLITEMLESDTEEKTVKKEGYTQYIKAGMNDLDDGSVFVAIDYVDDRDAELFEKLPDDWDDEDAIWDLVKDRTEITREEFFDIVDYHEYTYYSPWEFLCSFEELYDNR